MPPQAKPAATGIIRAFDQHRVVLLGEIHGSIEFDDLIKLLVQMPEFTGRVNDIVIEMGNAIHQPTLDRHIAGDEVAPNALQAGCKLYDRMWWGHQGGFQRLHIMDYSKRCAKRIASYRGPEGSGSWLVTRP